MDEKNHRTIWIIWIVAGVLFPALYVLSIGPAFWLLNADKLSVHTVNAVWKPLFWAGNNPYTGDACHPAMNWYVDLWIPAKPPTGGGIWHY